MKARMVVSALIGSVLLMGIAISAYAQDTKKAKENRVSGTVVRMNNDVKTITVRESHGAVERRVVYTDGTKFTKHNKTGGSIDDVKEGTRVICLGKFNDKSELQASRIDIRLPK